MLAPGRLLGRRMQCQMRELCGVVAVSGCTEVRVDRRWRVGHAARAKFEWDEGRLRFRAIQGERMYKVTF